MVFQSSVLSAAPILSLAFCATNERMYLGFSDGVLRIFDSNEEGGFKELTNVNIDKACRKYIHGKVCLFSHVEFSMVL